jgi:hypothetical protein
MMAGSSDNRLDLLAVGEALVEFSGSGGTSETRLNFTTLLSKHCSRERRSRCLLEPVLGGFLPVR